MAAKDWYFEVVENPEDDDGAGVAFVEVNFWNTHRHLNDEHVLDAIQPFLPANLANGLDEIAESVFFSQLDVETTKQSLLQAGFIEKTGLIS